MTHTDSFHHSPKPNESYDVVFHGSRQPQRGIFVQSTPEEFVFRGDNGDLWLAPYSEIKDIFSVNDISTIPEEENEPDNKESTGSPITITNAGQLRPDSMPQLYIEYRDPDTNEIHNCFMDIRLKTTLEVHNGKYTLATTDPVDYLTLVKKLNDEEAIKLMRGMINEAMVHFGSLHNQPWLSTLEQQLHIRTFARLLHTWLQEEFF